MDRCFYKLGLHLKSGAVYIEPLEDSVCNYHYSNILCVA